jgi:hypothetical protein
MNRRSFVVLSGLFLLGILIPFIQWIKSKAGKKGTLSQPKLLSLLCNYSTIIMLGNEYLKLKPREHGRDDLVNQIVNMPNVSQQDVQNSTEVEIQIEKQIRGDFESNRVIVLKGWVLSVTEARQCALFSILSS